MILEFNDIRIHFVPNVKITFAWSEIEGKMQKYFFR